MERRRGLTKMKMEGYTWSASNALTWAASWNGIQMRKPGTVPVMVPDFIMMERFWTDRLRMGLTHMMNCVKFKISLNTVTGKSKNKEVHRELPDGARQIQICFELAPE